MPKVRIAAFTISVDGYGAGPDQSLENPLGRWGDEPVYHCPVFVLTHHAPAARDEGRHHIPLRDRRPRRSAGPPEGSGRRPRHPNRCPCWYLEG